MGDFYGRPTPVRDRMREIPCDASRVVRTSLDDADLPGTALAMCAFFPELALGLPDSAKIGAFAEDFTMTAATRVAGSVDRANADAIQELLGTWGHIVARIESMLDEREVNCTKAVSETEPLLASMREVAARIRPVLDRGVPVWRKGGRRGEHARAQFVRATATQIALLVPGGDGKPVRYWRVAPAPRLGEAITQDQARSGGWQLAPRSLDILERYLASQEKARPPSPKSAARRPK